eukprot:SAG11_NODE_575_length_8420_cov_2.398149_7_plen_113_part_00
MSVSIFSAGHAHCLRAHGAGLCLGANVAEDISLSYNVGVPPSLSRCATLGILLRAGCPLAQLASLLHPICAALALRDLSAMWLVILILFYTGGIDISQYYLYAPPIWFVMGM